MNIFAFKTGPSIHDKLLRNDSGLDIEFQTFQIVFDPNIKIMKEDDLDQFQKIHVPVTSIMGDSFIRTVAILDATTEQPFNPGKFASLYTIQLTDGQKGFLVKTEENSSSLFNNLGHDIDTLANKNLLNALAGIGNRAIVNSTVTRVPNCPPPNGI